MGNEILIIEDNEQNIYLVTFLLEKNGYNVIQARDGAEGIKMAKDYKPMLVLLDIQLPVIDGHEVARQLKSNLKTKDIPIVAITSYAMVGDREKVLEAGCSGYIEKPINPDLFIDEIKPFIATE